MKCGNSRPRGSGGTGVCAFPRRVARAVQKCQASHAAAAKCRPAGPRGLVETVFKTTNQLACHPERFPVKDLHLYLSGAQEKEPMQILHWKAFRMTGRARCAE